MKTLILTLFCGSVCLIQANAQNSHWTIGPAVALNQYKVSLPNENIKSANIINSLSISYGIYFSYKFGRLLLDIKGLTSNRTYTYSQGYPITVDPTATSSSRIEAHYYTVPLTLSFLVYDTPKFQFFAGAGVLTEWQSGDFIAHNQSEYAGIKRSNVNSLPGMTKAMNGWSLQTVVRYKLTDRVLVSLEPTYRHLPQFGVPAGHQNSDVVNLLFSAGYKF